ADLRLATSTTGTRFTVSNQAARIDDACTQQRQKAKLHSRRIAAGIRNETRALDGFAIDFAKTIHGFVEQMWARVRHAVPLLPHLHVLDPEVGGEVDDFDASIEQILCHLHRSAVRRS